MKKLCLGLICIVVAVAVVCAGCTPKDTPKQEQDVAEMDMLTTALELIRDNYIGQVNMDNLDYAAAKAVIDGLDNFTYLTTTYYSQTTDSRIGLELAITRYNEYIITYIEKDMPADVTFEDGFHLQRGDEIYGVANSNDVDADGNPIFHRVRGLASSYYSGYVEGDEDTVLTLRIARNGEIVGDYAFGKTKRYAPRAYFVPDVYGDGTNVGYISLRSFTYTQLPDGTVKSAADDFDECMRQFLEAGQSKLVLDLRNNGGGNTDILSSVASYFVPVEPGEMTEILQLQYAKSDKVVHVNVKKDNYIADLPLVILCNANTASAAEALIGACRAYNGKNTTVIGQNTYGKGVFQRTDLTIEDQTESGKVTGILDKYYVVMVSGYYYIVDPAKENGMYNIHQNPLIPDVATAPTEEYGALSADNEMVAARSALLGTDD